MKKRMSSLVFGAILIGGLVVAFSLAVMAQSRPDGRPAWGGERVLPVNIEVQGYGEGTPKALDSFSNRFYRAIGIPWGARAEREYVKEFGPLDYGLNPFGPMGEEEK